jgi:hypothetical protein
MEFPLKIMDAFNIGDMQKLSDIIDFYLVENCTLKSPATNTEKYGRHEVFQLHKAIQDDYPDAVLVFKDITMTEKYGLKYRFYFTGTMEKPRNGSKVYSKGSIVDHVKLAKYSPEEILEMTSREKELRASKKPIHILVKGETRLHFNRGFKVTSFEIDFSVQAFEADTS